MALETIGTLQHTPVLPPNNFGVPVGTEPRQKPRHRISLDFIAARVGTNISRPATASRAKPRGSILVSRDSRTIGSARRSVKIEFKIRAERV